ncbi:TRAP transporter substrate-binding protein [Rhodobium gokarnense]|uniref:Tripartite ATP-independent transporter DctP family solute receptor n=1 Tax=Rhodobium gokarnense TaxID=364296 RepID=A0ABT3HF55_9HYPH|nr:TRAP transporter substrate-binding protein [Rhodobium gokarnense]MCW2309032.1 tripartite ATP-independent transporter DctP family solute receptor [Rhodobium gokarnense]
MALTIDRRRFVLAGGTAALAAPFILSGKARAAEFNYKFANNLTTDHALNVRVNEAIERIREESGGRVDIMVFPNNQLGSDTDTLSQLRSGAVEFFTLSGLILSTLVPIASINGIGFAFPDYETVWKTMDGDLGAHVRAGIEKSGLHAMEKIFDNGFRQVTTSTKPITGPDDLAGLKIRVPPSPLWTSMFQALGSAPVSINWNEVYTSLQTHVADAQENPLSTIKIGRLYEVQKYVSMTNHMWDGFWFLANSRAWGALPEDLQEIVSRNINQAAVEERADSEENNHNLRAELEGLGLTFNAPETGPIREKLRSAGFYDQWKKEYGEEAWSLLEQTTGKLG